MKRPQRSVIIGLVLAAILIGAVSVVRSRLGGAARNHAAATYYCPMHPTYTSDRPGTCPICNMSLVKKEPELSGQATSAKDQGKASVFESICYLHNCEKLHEGKPCPMTVVAKPGERVTCPICGTHIAEGAPADSGRKVLYWTDPMIPGYKAEGPGKSPMGMELVPVYEEEAAAGAGTIALEGYAPVMLTPQKQQLIGVTTAPVQRRTMTKAIRAASVVAHDPELYQAQQEFIQANQAWQQARDRQQPEVAEQARRLAESARLRLRHLGLNEELIDEVAGWTAPDHRLLLGGAGQFWVYASIYEYELPWVRPGIRAVVEVSAVPGYQFAGTVKAIDPMLDAMTRTARVRILVNDPDGLLKPEMFATATILAPLGDQLAVPQEALFDTGTRQLVFVDIGQGVFEPRQVAIGGKAEGYVQVKAGLSEGEAVVTSGNFLIDSESRLKAALQGAGTEGHQHGQ